MATFFLAGIIQGSLDGTDIHAQDYRGRLRATIEEAVPDADVYCPVDNHPGSEHYPAEKAVATFLDLMARAAATDVLVAYLPEASMGTAIELWQAHRAGRLALVISPLAENWVVRSLATRLFATVEQFESFAASGELEKLVNHGPC